jgi:PAS domain S-box-containing protein
VVWANKYLVDLGVAPNKKCDETFNNLGVVCPDCGIEQVFHQNVSLDVREYETVNSKGETTWVELRVTPLKDKDGNVIAALILAVPLNERKKTNAQLVFQSKLLEAVGESIIATDMQGKIVFWNGAASRVYGWDAKETLGRNIADVIVPEISKEDSAKIMKKLGKGKSWSGEFQVKRRDGKVFPALVTDSPVLDEKGELSGVIGVSVDMTKTKNLERELSNLAKFPSENPYSVIRVNGKGVILYANLVSQRLPLSTSLKVGQLIPEKWRVLAAQALSSERQLDFEIETKGHWFLFKIAPIIAECYVNIYGLDITEHKKAEEELKKDKAKIEIMNEKLNVVGKLTRHDVGNKLMVMKSNIYLLKKQISDNPKLAKYLEDIDSAINQSDEMFEFSRFYEKIGVEKPSEEDIAQCFNQAATLLPNLGSIKIVNDCQGLRVTADSLLKQLFYNFLDNSLKHGEKVTQIRLHFTDEDGGIKLFYEDDGVGIPEANKIKLFHEGFTTGKSTGLGLFLTKKMIEVYGWTITEEGEPGKGAKFVITIPKVNQKKN